MLYFCPGLWGANGFGELLWRLQWLGTIFGIRFGSWALFSALHFAEEWHFSDCTWPFDSLGGSLGCELGFPCCGARLLDVVSWGFFFLNGYLYLWDSQALFGSICLDAFWTLSFGLSLDFIFFQFLFSILSTQGTFNGDGHPLFMFCHFSSVLVALYRHLVEQGYT